MPLDPISAFAIACGCCAMAVGHTLRMARGEAQRRLAARRVYADR